MRDYRPRAWRARLYAVGRWLRDAWPLMVFNAIGVALGLVLAHLVACRAPTPLPHQPVVAPIAPTSPRHCMRPPPAAPEMTGDESIDRHRRDWHRERLIAWAAGVYEACRP